MKWRANRDTCCTYDICVFGARFRTCMSSVMRCRRDAIRETPLRNGMCCKQLLNAFAKWSPSNGDQNRARRQRIGSVYDSFHRKPAKGVIPMGGMSDYPEKEHGGSDWLNGLG